MMQGHLDLLRVTHLVIESHTFIEPEHSTTYSRSLTLVLLYQLDLVNQHLHKLFL